MTKQYTIPIFVPHYGCPFDCVFCNQKRITGYSTDVNGDTVRNTIEEYLSYFDREARIEVGFFGGSFTGIDEKIQRELLQIAKEYKIKGKIDGIRLSTRPDFIDQDILCLLKEYSVDTIELGVQSLNDGVLLKSGRGHTSKDVYKAIELIQSNGINLGLQMMTGLPGDDFNKSLDTCIEFIKINPYCVRIYPTLIIKDTYLERAYLEGKYKPLELKKAITDVAIYLMLFELENIDVIRVGLQATDNIQLYKDVVAGPFHPSFKQLVQSYIYMEILELHLKDLQTENSRLIINANNKDISSIVGQKGINKNELYNKYKFKDIKFNGNLEFETGSIEIKIDNYSKTINYKKTIELILKEKSTI